MSTVISIIILVLVFAFWRSNKEEEARKRRDMYKWLKEELKQGKHMYNNLNKKSVDEMEKWRR